MANCGLAGSDKGRQGGRQARITAALVLRNGGPAASKVYKPVSYTHLTLPTKA